MEAGPTTEKASGRNHSVDRVIFQIEGLGGYINDLVLNVSHFI